MVSFISKYKYFSTYMYIFYKDLKLCKIDKLKCTNE